MSVIDYEVGRRPGPPTRTRLEVDPITLRVLGGAFHAIAKEMAGVLFRMSYSSIIRESEYLGASHAPDVAGAVPIFADGELLGFAAVTAHVLDVGGSFPGINADAFDVYAESKLYNGLRWYRRGELNEDLDRMIFENVRTETMNRGDMEAMLAACQLGEGRFLRLLERYGVDVVMSAAYDWMD